MIVVMVNFVMKVLRAFISMLEMMLVVLYKLDRLVNLQPRGMFKHSPTLSMRYPLFCWFVQGCYTFCLYIVSYDKHLKKSLERHPSFCYTILMFPKLDYGSMRKYQFKVGFFLLLQVFTCIGFN